MKTLNDSDQMHVVELSASQIKWLKGAVGDRLSDESVAYMNAIEDGRLKAAASHHVMVKMLTDAGNRLADGLSAKSFMRALSSEVRATEAGGGAVCVSLSGAMGGAV